MAKKWWIESLGRIELEMTIEQAEMVPLSGQADDGVMLLSEEDDMIKQLDKYTPELIAECLSEYGAWNDEELKDHDQNIQRLLWLAASDIQEQDDDDDDDSLVTCTGCNEIVKEHGYCNKDGSAFGECCWGEHADKCEPCKEDVENE